MNSSHAESQHQNIIITGRSELKPIDKTITAIDSVERSALVENEKLGEITCLCVMAVGHDP